MADQTRWMTLWSHPHKALSLRSGWPLGHLVITKGKIEGRERSGEKGQTQSKRCMNYKSLQESTKQERKECTKLAMTLHGKQK